MFRDVRLHGVMTVMMISTPMVFSEAVTAARLLRIGGRRR